MNKLLPQSRKNDLVVQQLENEILVFNTKNNKAFCLNNTSAAIWLKCNGKNSLDDITTKTRLELGNSVDRDFVSLALDQLEQNELLEHSFEVSNSLRNVSRRQLIKKVGAGSMIALPIISSIAVPSALHAQSLLANGQTCTGNGNCISDCCAGGTCRQAGVVLDGSFCSASCQCVSGNCVGFCI